MNNAHSRRRSYPTLLFAGTPRNQEARRKELVRNIRAEMADASRKLKAGKALLEALERGLTRDVLAQAMNRFDVMDVVERLLGLPRNLHASYWERRRSVFARLFSSSQEPQCEEKDRFEPDTKSAADRVLEQAKSIARAANVQVDFTREPLCDVEASKRRAWLAKQLCDASSAQQLLMLVLSRRIAGRYIAADVEAACDRARMMLGDQQAARE